MFSISSYVFKVNVKEKAFNFYFSFNNYAKLNDKLFKTANNSPSIYKKIFLPLTKVSGGLRIGSMSK